MKSAASKPSLNNFRRQLLWTRQADLHERIATPRQDEIDRLTEQNNQLRARLAQCEEIIARSRVQSLIDSQFRTELLSRVNHDMRQPLGVILGFAEMLHDGIFGPVIEAQQRVLAEMIQSNQRLSRMVTDLLDSARLESRNLQLHVDAFSPEQLLHQVHQQMGQQAEDKGLALQTGLDPQLPETLQGDANRLIQILNHLVENAIKFTPQGNVSVHAYLADAEHWALSVADTGCGIPAEALERIFEPFSQVNDPTAREMGELGLGLFIVQQFVQLMDGQIRVDSTVGVGSTFTVILPFDPMVMKGE